MLPRETCRGIVSSGVLDLILKRTYNIKKDLENNMVGEAEKIPIRFSFTPEGAAGLFLRGRFGDQGRRTRPAGSCRNTQSLLEWWV